jgi:antitoxin MazE
MPKTHIAKWGKSQAVHIPKAAAERAGLEEGDPIVIEALDGRLELRPVKKALTLEELVAKITPENCHEEIKWGPAVGKEIVGW